MAHFAKLNLDNIVTDVVVVSNEDLQNLKFPESEPVGIAFLTNLYGEEYIWKQTSYNANFRANYAGIGAAYDPQKDAFIPVKPYLQWVLNEQTLNWEAPFPVPDSNNTYEWDGNLGTWVNVADRIK
jgi:hypothetical protein